MPTKDIIARKSFLCFSHTHKGQSHNMKMLSRFAEDQCTLIDYELLTDDSGRRQVAFGKFAGYAGMINCLHGLGLQLLRKGFRTPFVVNRRVEGVACIFSVLHILIECRS